MNVQKPEPFAKGDGVTLDLHSIFFTIQGEGPYTGHRAVFIRLAGCNLQCPGCDTEYTQGRRQVETTEIVSHVNALQLNSLGALPLIVITGGEPFRQPIGRLVDLLVTNGYRVQVESNGVLPPCGTVEYLAQTGKVDVIISPKTVRVHEGWRELARAWKYVLDHRSVDQSDGLPIRALEHTAPVGVARPPWRLVAEGRVYLNPCDTGDAAHNALNLDAVKRSCTRFGYVAGVQLHKLMNVE